MKIIKQLIGTSLVLSLAACTTTRPGKQEASARRNPLKDMQFYVDKDSIVIKEAAKLEKTDPHTAGLMSYLASQPAGIWFGAWSGPIKETVASIVKRADAEGTHLVGVVYNVPYRDCGQHSAGGLEAGAYQKWIEDFAAGLGTHKAVLILEPDAIPLITCLTPEMRATRWKLLHEAIEIFKSKTAARVYVDVGHGNWIAAGIMVERLKAIGIDKADGFAINTSNYQSTADSIKYAEKLMRAFPDKGFVIDTGRNGNGPAPDQAWCNPRGRAIGQRPAVVENTWQLDAYLWTKKPGESDGACNGGPAAGEFWLDIARELVENGTRGKQ
jgi:endoglucanase